MMGQNVVYSLKRNRASQHSGICHTRFLGAQSTVPQIGVHKIPLLRCPRTQSLSSVILW